MEKYRHYEEVRYLYDNENEKDIHSKEMCEKGFEDSGTYAMQINSLMSKNPEHRLCGVYFRYHK